MSLRPRFKRYFRCEIIPAEGIVVLLSERAHFLLRGNAYVQLAPFLNGQYTEDDIVDQLQGRLSAAEVFYALDRLRREGHVVDTTPAMPSEHVAFWELLDVAADAVDRRLQKTTVSVAAFGTLDPAPLANLLTDLGIRVSDEGERWVVLTDDYLRDDLDIFNREALRRKRPWLLTKPVGAELWLGPLMLPERTGCWACLAHRLQGHRKIESFLRQYTGHTGPFTVSDIALPSTYQTALGMAATEIAKWIVCDQNARIEGRIVTLNMLSLEQHSHVLVRRPQCPHCGDPPPAVARPPVPLVLQSRRKFFTADGGHRSFAPENTIQKLQHHISPITGIIHTLRPTPTPAGANGLTPSYIADHHFIPVDNDLSFLRESLRSRSGGKGKRDAQAKASALCEALERYSGVFQGDEARIQASRKALGTRAIPPNACMLFSQRQYDNRAQWLAKRTRSTWVADPFDATMEIEWSPVWSLTCNEPRYIPTAYCYYGYSRRYNAWFAQADSNGCAAGRSKEEATLQGFMELVERDSVALWWYNRLAKPAVDLASFDEPYFQDLLAYYQTLQRDLWVLDITSDFNIPAFAAVSRRHDKESEDILLGFGAHFDPQLAIRRALTEVNQSLPIVISVLADDGEPYLDRNPEAVAWWKTATIANQPYLRPDKTVTPKLRSDYPVYESDDLRTDVMTCVRVAADLGLETLVLDQSRPDIGLDVVKVFVPGLRHFWARFGPGRLYEVPVHMGWLAEPLTEDQLNPSMIYF